MSTVHPASPRLVLADIVPGARARDAALVVAGAALTGLAAQLSIATPLSPVPFTLQTLAVLVTGAALGSLRGLLSMALYVVAGVAGVPWFASSGAGWGGPTFGYILGFVIAAAVVGALAERRADRHIGSTVAMMLAGNVLIYAIGTMWLAADLELSFSEAIRLGVTPFLLTDLLKIAVAALALPGAWKLAGS